MVKSTPSEQLGLWTIPATRAAMPQAWRAALLDVIPGAQITRLDDWTNDRCEMRSQMWSLRIEWADQRGAWLGWAYKLPKELVCAGDIWRNKMPFYGGADHDPDLDVWEFKMSLHKDIPGGPPTFLVCGRGQRITPEEAIRVALARCIERRNGWYECAAKHDSTKSLAGVW